MLFPTYLPISFMQPVLLFPSAFQHYLPNLYGLSQDNYFLPQIKASIPIQSSSSGYKRVYSRATKIITWQPVNSSPLENSQAPIHVYYPKGQKTCTEAIYLFRRSNRIEEIPYLIPDTSSAEQQDTTSIDTKSI